MKTLCGGRGAFGPADGAGWRRHAHTTASSNRRRSTIVAGKIGDIRGGFSFDVQPLLGDHPGSDVDRLGSAAQCRADAARADALAGSAWRRRSSAGAS